jgi:hypothetical protein
MGQNNLQEFMISTGIKVLADILLNIFVVVYIPTGV